MKTDQDKVIQLLGVDKYNLLIENGFFPIETESLKRLLNYQEQMKKLQDTLDEIDKRNLLQQKEPSMLN